MLRAAPASARLAFVVPRPSRSRSREQSTERTRQLRCSSPVLPACGNHHDARCAIQSGGPARDARASPPLFRPRKRPRGSRTRDRSPPLPGGASLPVSAGRRCVSSCSGKITLLQSTVSPRDCCNPAGHAYVCKDEADDDDRRQCSKRDRGPYASHNDQMNGNDAQRSTDPRPLRRGQRRQRALDKRR
jgi:hypothetical protein